MATLSAANQIKMSSFELNSQIMQGVYNASSNVSNQQKQTEALTSALTSKSGAVYAVKGDNKYKKEIDYNSDGIISFSEYAKYISEQKISNNEALKNLVKYTKSEDAETEKITIQNIGKAIRSYQTLSALLPQGIINAKV